MLDRGGVGCSVRGDDTVVVLEVAAVVLDVAAEEVGKPPAGFLEDHLRGAGVPKFGAGTGVNVDIAFAAGDERNF